LKNRNRISNCWAKVQGGTEGRGAKRKYVEKGVPRHGKPSSSKLVKGGGKRRKTLGEELRDPNFG